MKLAAICDAFRIAPIPSLEIVDSLDGRMNQETGQYDPYCFGDVVHDAGVLRIRLSKQWPREMENTLLHELAHIVAGSAGHDYRFIGALLAIVRFHYGGALWKYSWDCEQDWVQQNAKRIAAGNQPLPFIAESSSVGKTASHAA